MLNCKECGREAAVLFDGKCAQCLSIEAEEEGRYIEDEHDISDLQVNTPLSTEQFIQIVKRLA